MRKVFLVVLLAFFVLGAFPSLNWADENPCIEIEKQVSVDGGNTWLDADSPNDAPTVVDGVEYRYIVTNCGDSLLYKDCGVIIDKELGIHLPWWGNVGPGDVVYINKDTRFPDFESLYQPDLCEEHSGLKVNTVVVEASASDECVEASASDECHEKLTDQDSAWVNCDSDEGCTPGYWKQPQHFDSWPAPYTPETLFSDVFEGVIEVKFKEKGVKGKPPLLNNPTLIQALRAKGGKVNALARQAVAALLNATSPDVNYPIELGMVFILVNDALSDTTGESIEAVKNILETNNELVCPLNGDDV